MARLYGRNPTARRTPWPWGDRACTYAARNVRWDATTPPRCRGSSVLVPAPLPTSDGATPNKLTSHSPSTRKSNSKALVAVARYQSIRFVLRVTQKLHDFLLRHLQPQRPEMFVAHAMEQREIALQIDRNKTLYAPRWFVRRRPKRRPCAHLQERLHGGEFAGRHVMIAVRKPHSR